MGRGLDLDIPFLQVLSAKHPHQSCCGELLRALAIHASQPTECTVSGTFFTRSILGAGCLIRLWRPELFGRFTRHTAAGALHSKG